MQIRFVLIFCLKMQRCPHGVMVKALHYYIHFQTNTLGKGMNPQILPAMG